MSLTDLHSILQLIPVLSALGVAYVALNNRIIKTESKALELESRLNRKDEYDKELKAEVGRMSTLLTRIDAKLETVLENEKS